MAGLSPLRITTKAPQIMALIAGGFGVILGLAVMVAWQFPLSIGFGVLTANLFLCEVITNWENILIKQLATVAGEVKLLLSAVAKLVLLEGLMLILLVTLVLYFAQLAWQQANKLKQINHYLVESNSLLQATLESTDDGILVLDVQQKKINFNNQFLTMWQVPDSVIKTMRSGHKQPILSLIAAQLQDPEGFLQKINQLLNYPDQETDEIWEFQDGRVFELSSRPQKIGDRSVGRVLNFRDITNRRRAEMKLRESEARFQAFMDYSPVLEWIANQDGHLIYVNQPYVRTFGQSINDDVVGKTVFNLFPDEFAQRFLPNIQAVAQTHQAFETVESILESDGSISSYLVLIFPILGSSEPYLIGGIAKNITVRQRAQEQVHQLKTMLLAIAQSPDFNSALAQVLQSVCKTSHWNYGEAWIPCPKDQVLQCSPAWYINNYEKTNQVFQIHEFREVSENLAFTMDMGIPGRVWASQQPEWQEDVSLQSETLFLRHYANLQIGFKAALAIPVVVNQQVLAVLVFFKLAAAIEDKQMVDSISAIATQLGLLLQRKQMEEALFHEKELAQVTLKSIGDAVITTNATGKIEYFNPVAETLTGWTHQEVQGLPITEVFKIFHETTREPAENPITKALQSGQIVGLANHTVLITRDNREIAIDDSAAPIRDRHNQIVGAVMVFHDVTQHRILSHQLSWQASHDSLTGLVNRHEFEQCLEQAVISARTYNLEHALCYLDLDQFKIVNDTCGHAAGDELLRQITTVLQTKIRQTDILARLGGDEFGALLYQCSLEQAMRVANLLRESLKEFRFVWQDNIFAVGVSIGLVEINADSESRVSLLSSADAACYAAKNKGRNRVHVVQPNDEELLQQRGEMQWVSRITRALAENRFCLYSQLIAAIAPSTSEEMHYEVLLRLRDEQGNLVAPMAFIPAAERYNLMPTIDRWVIHTLFKYWSSVEHDSKIVYAINLSGTSINDDQFIGFLHEQFSLYQVPPQSICFEITETVAITNLSKANQFICELQRCGYRFALDDFGSGMSSFAYLKSLPVNYLKIDGGFIKNIVDNSVDDAMVKAMTHIGHVMGVKMIAEFVENDAILQRIKTLGVDYAQGYGVAEPYPLVFTDS